MEKTKFEKNLKRVEIYQELINSYNEGISLNSITNMLNHDYIVYMRKIKYSFNGIKESYNLNNPTVIQDEDDLVDVRAAYEFFLNKIQRNDKENFYDLVLKQKQAIINDNDGINVDSVMAMMEYDIKLFEENEILDRFIENETEESLEAFTKQEDNITAIKTKKDKEIRKLALELIKKETTNY